MQEDKAPLFHTVDTLEACIEIYTRLLPRLRFDVDAMASAASRGYLNATDMADYLVSRGIPFRDAHHCVGKAVGYAVDHRKELHELTLEELRGFSPAIEEDIFDVLSVAAVIDRRKSYGGTATDMVASAIETARKHLAQLEAQ
jgi:argininosuccinate lyase